MKNRKTSEDPYEDLVYVLMIDSAVIDAITRKTTIDLQTTRSSRAKRTCLLDVRSTMWTM